MPQLGWCSSLCSEVSLGKNRETPAEVQAGDTGSSGSKDGIERKIWKYTGGIMVYIHVKLKEREDPGGASSPVTELKDLWVPMP